MLEFREVNRHWPTWLHRIHQTEMIERRAVLLESFRQVHDEFLVFPLLMFFAVAYYPERGTATPVVPVRGIIQTPHMARSILADRRGPELAGNERRDKSPATLVVPVNHPHRQARAGAFAIEIHSERVDRAPTSARLSRIEPAEENAAVA